MKKIYTLLAALVLTASAFAQAPEKMSYQAVVRDASNNLVTSQAVGMQISILQGSVSGAAVYIETQTPTTNINGLVSIEIGSGSVVSGAFGTIDWGSGLYFIKTETDPTGGTTYTITGTSQLMSVPYALHANTADSIAGGVSITETDPLFGASLASGITALDTANWNNHTIDTDTQIDSAGIASLGYVAGPHTVDTQLDSTGVALLGYVAGPHTIDTDTQLDSTGVALLGYVAGPHTIDTDTQIDSAGIASLGYVAGPHTIDTQLDSTGVALLGYVAGPHTIDTDTQIDSAGIASLGYVAGPHTIDTQLDSTGVALLGYVAGPHTIDTDTQLDSVGIASLGYVAGPHTMPKIAIADTNAVPRWDGSNLVDGTLTDDGTYIGIGTTSPNHQLEIKGQGMGFSQTSPNGLRKIGTYADNGALYIQTHTNDNLNFATNNGNAQMTLGTNGNFGIGISAPSATLDVEGTFQLLDGTQGAGKVLTSDATGNASWQDASVAPGTTAGEMLYWDGSTWVAVAPGTIGQVLTFGSAGPIWQTHNYSITVQQRLSGGETPFAIYSSDNTLLDSLYGKTYQGGLIAYLNTTTGTGLIAATSDHQSNGSQWYNGSLTTTGATGIAIGTGQSNTIAIITLQGAGSYAASLCDSYSVTLGAVTYTDWFLPSKDELNQLYQNLKLNNFGGFASNFYWSSTEYFNVVAWTQDFYNGLQSYDNKGNTYRVRAVRAF
jgi:hypothetical protein